MQSRILAFSGSYVLFFFGKGSYMPYVRGRSDYYYYFINIWWVNEVEVTKIHIFVHQHETQIDMLKYAADLVS